MALSQKHIEFLNDFVLSGTATQSYKKIYGCSEKTARTNGNLLLKRPEAKKFLKLLLQAREDAAVKAMERIHEKFFSEQIAQEAELDIFHTAVMRGQVEVEEVFQVKEDEYVQKDGNYVRTGRQITAFKKIKRPPTVRERQISAAELYRRKGSYKQPLRQLILPVGGQDDQAAAARANGSGIEQIERCVVLSNGEKIPMQQ